MQYLQIKKPLSKPIEYSQPLQCTILFFCSEIKTLVLINLQENLPISLFPFFICTLFNIFK